MAGAVGFASIKLQCPVRKAQIRLRQNLCCVLCMQTDQVLDPFLTPSPSLPSDATQTEGRPAARGAAPYMPQQRTATQDMGTDGLPDGMEDFDYQVCSNDAGQTDPFADPILRLCGGMSPANLRLCGGMSPANRHSCV